MYNFRLRELRKERNISQIQLALELDTTQNTISRYETCQRQANYDMLIRIATFFDVSIDYLLGYSDNSTRHL